MAVLAAPPEQPVRRRDARRTQRRRPPRWPAAWRWSGASAALAVAALGAVWLGAWRLGVPSEVGDEVVYRTAAEALLRGDWTPNNEHPLLVKELLAAAQWAGAHVGVGSVLASRLVGVVCFLATGFVVAATARRLHTPAAGVVAAATWWYLPLAPGVVVAHVDRYALLEGPLLLAVAGAVHVSVVLAVAPRSRTTTWALAGLLVGLATACKLPGALSAAGLLVPLVVQGAAAWRGAGRAGSTVALRVRGTAAVAARAVLAAAVAVVAFLLTYLPAGAWAPTALRTVVESQLVHAGTGHLQTVAGTTYAFPPWWSQWWFQAQYLGWAGVAVLHALALAWVVRSLRGGGAERPGGLVLGVHLLVVGLALAGMSLKLPHYSGLLQAPLAVTAGCALAWLAGTALRSGGWLRRTAAGAALALAALPLVALAGHHAAAVAAIRTADYRAVAGAVVDAGLDGPAAGPAVVWADRGAVQSVLPGLVTTRDLPAEGLPRVVVVDDTVVDRLPGEPRAWLAEHADEYAQRSDGRVTVYVRAGDEPPQTAVPSRSDQ